MQEYFTQQQYSVVITFSFPPICCSGITRYVEMYHGRWMLRLIKWLLSCQNMIFILLKCLCLLFIIQLHTAWRIFISNEYPKHFFKDFVLFSRFTFTSMQWLVADMAVNYSVKWETGYHSVLRSLSLNLLLGYHFWLSKKRFFCILRKVLLLYTNFSFQSLNKNLKNFVRWLAAVWWGFSACILLPNGTLFDKSVDFN